jgi:hypothetical protein
MGKAGHHAAMELFDGTTTGGYQVAINAKDRAAYIEHMISKMCFMYKNPNEEVSPNHHVLVVLH